MQGEFFFNNRQSTDLLFP